MSALGRGRGVLLVLLVALPGCEPCHLEHAADGHRSGYGCTIGNRGEGRWTFFDERGARAFTGGLSEGLPDGIWKRFYADGALQEHGVLLRGLREGPTVTFHPDGSRESSGSYRNGVREGAWVFWTPNGDVDVGRTGAYVGGNRQGL